MQKYKDCVSVLNSKKTQQDVVIETVKKQYHYLFSVLLNPNISQVNSFC